MDLTAEFYLQTVRTVFQEHLLPDRKLMHRGELVDCSAITKTALMTIEGERDDICGLGQTEAAHDLCTSIPSDEKVHYVQSGVGHYGVFNGTRWRTEIQPRIREFIRDVNYKHMTASGTSRMSRPQHALKDKPADPSPDWRKKGSGLNGANGNHAPETAIGK
jgi:poly(3-hydroxybutyrate) depolymerase